MKNEFYPAYKIGNYHSSFLILHLIPEFPS
jgi:hypothetical protein